MKKKLFVTAIVASMLVTGCTHVPELTKSDNNMAAEYMAGSLLKYDKEYEYALDYDRSILQATPEPTPTPVPVATPAVSPAGNGAEATEEPIQNVSLSEIYGQSGVRVTQTSYSLKKSFGTDYSAVTAGEGKKLLIVYFQVKNTSEKMQEVNLMTAKLSYLLKSGEETLGKPLLTIAEGDLQYFDRKIKSGKSNQGVLVFEVDAAVNVQNTVIEADRDRKRAVISLK